MLLGENYFLTIPLQQNNKVKGLWMLLNHLDKVFTIFILNKNILFIYLEHLSHQNW